MLFCAQCFQFFKVNSISLILIWWIYFIKNLKKIYLDSNIYMERILKNSTPIPDHYQEFRIFCLLQDLLMIDLNNKENFLIYVTFILVKFFLCSDI